MSIVAAKSAQLAPAVVDASVSVSWVLKEQEGSGLAESLFLQGHRGERELWVPCFWLWECGNVMLTYRKQKHIAQNDVPELLRMFRYPEIQFDATPDVSIQAQTIQIAHTAGLSYYDASYIELAQRKNAELATFDQAMKTAAHGLGITCLDL